MNMEDLLSTQFVKLKEAMDDLFELKNAVGA